MSIKEPEVIIDSQSPFKDCILNRKQYADILTNLFLEEKDGFVMSINNKWGTGKTTFVKMWIQQLKNEGFNTIYFNAWENDFEDNVFAALMGELKDVFKSEQEADYKMLLEKGAIVARNILPGVIKAIISKYIDVEGLEDYVKDSTTALTEIFEKDVEAYLNKKKSVEEFKEKLKTYIKNNSGSEKPLIFIIDELDRCRPNYSVSVLEQIKHFFSVNGIVFVLSIDKEQLGHAIRGVYGSDRIDAEEYLRRFIDIEYSLPVPKQGEYIKYLYEILDFDLYFDSKERKRYRGFEYDKTSFLKVAKILLSAHKFSLRQQYKILSHARIVLKTFDYNQYVFPNLLLYLIYVRTLYPKIYDELKNTNVSIYTLQDYFSETLDGIGIDDENKRTLLVIESYLLNFYNNSYRENRGFSEGLFEKVDGGDGLKLKYKSKIGRDLNDYFEGVLENIVNNWDYGDVSLDFIIKRIDLMETIKS